MTISRLCFVAIVLFFNVSLLAQQPSIDGTYGRSITTVNGGVISYNLLLKQDSTFTFTYYRKLSTDRAEQTTHCEGTWIVLDAKKVELIANTELFDTPNFINLKDTKAHFITKSPRDKSSRKIPTSLKFYESNIPWIKGIPLEKQ